jgi:hypothetical protein
MHSHQEHYIHELSPQTILEIIGNDAWRTNNQTITLRLPILMTFQNRILIN